MNFEELPLIDELLDVMYTALSALGTISNDCAAGDLNNYKDEYTRTYRELQTRYNGLWDKIRVIANADVQEGSVQDTVTNHDTCDSPATILPGGYHLPADFTAYVREPLHIDEGDSQH